MLKKNLFGDTEAYLIFDDTVINNKLGYNLVSWLWQMHPNVLQNLPKHDCTNFGASFGVSPIYHRPKVERLTNSLH